MSRTIRKKLIQEIQNKRGSKVISYVTSDRPHLQARMASDIVSILHEHILSIAPSKRNKLDLFIYSRGGDSDVPWSIVSMVREYTTSGSFSVLIPYRAHSAATVIALGADEIVMTKKAELGPIDITMESGPYNPQDESKNRLPVSVEDVMGYFSLLEKIGCERPDEIRKGFEQLVEQVHPLVLGNVSRLLEQTELVALRLLGTRANPFHEEKNREIVKRLSSEIFSHRHTISRTEAVNYLGLEHIVHSEDQDIDEDLWKLYKEYRKLFSLEERFLPEQHLLANDLEEHTWEKLNVACVESEKRLDIAKTDVRVKRLRQIPPQVNVNLQNISFPTVNIPTLPAGITPQQIQDMVQQVVLAVAEPILKKAAEDGVESLRKSLPFGQFERVQLNEGWQTLEGAD